MIALSDTFGGVSGVLRMVFYVHSRTPNYHEIG